MNQAIEWINEEWKKIDNTVDIAAKEYINEKKLDTNYINLYKFLFFCFSYFELFIPAEKYEGGGICDFSYLVFKLPFELYKINIKKNNKNDNLIMIDIIKSFTYKKDKKENNKNQSEINKRIILINEDMQRESNRFLEELKFVLEGEKQDLGVPLKTLIKNIRAVRKMIRNNVEYPIFFYEYFSLINENIFQNIKNSRFYDWMHFQTIK